MEVAQTEVGGAQPLFDRSAPLGLVWQWLTDDSLAFSFAGLLVASVIFNLPFAVQPIQRAFEAINREVRDAAACCGMSPWRALWRVELPLAWPGVVTAMVLSFAHTCLFCQRVFGRVVIR